MTSGSPPTKGAFPTDFVWGVSTSAYQIEGAVAVDGGGRSIWDTFAATPGRVRGGVGGEVAADHRHRMVEDVELIASLGVDAYRFSVSWPRVQPGGRGPANAPGLAFYDRLVDELLRHGIEPVATLYHWDLPQELEDEGGWPERDTAHRFADYAALVGARLGDRVVRWSTVNEPWCSAVLGYSAGIHAPGRRDPAAAVAAAHHLLLGHGLAVDELRGAGVTGAVGVTLNPYPVVAAGDRPEDLDAARRVDGVANRLWWDPIFRGRYPDDLLEDLAPLGFADVIRDGDLEQISRPLDALGLNYYRRHHVRHEPGASVDPAMWPGSPDVGHVEPPGDHTALGWAVEPDGLTEVLVMAAEVAPVALHVDENGAAFDDPPTASAGAVEDPERVRFISDHIAAVSEARARGVDVRGYFVWSLMDNFEWAEGYDARFGVVHVDFSTQQRTVKTSGDWYRRFLTGRATS